MASEEALKASREFADRRKFDDQKIEEYADDLASDIAELLDAFVAARVAKLEAELKKYTDYVDIEVEARDRAEERATSAEAERDRLRAALEQIATAADSDEPWHMVGQRAVNVARSALTPSPRPADPAG